MNGQPLTAPDGTVAAFFCAKCRIVKRTKEIADKCCTCQTCGIESNKLECDSCVTKRLAATEQKHFDSAKKISTEQYTGGIIYCDDFYASVDDLFDQLENDDVEKSEWPEWVYGCTERPVLRLNVDDIIDNGTQEAYEDFDTSDLRGVDDFRNAVKAFVDANASVIMWEPDYRTVVLLTQPKTNQ
ncbi:MAG: hypothetical protein JSS75_07295 [Bacteroidetes bacterium]|nr:hypothetical protein [Bacteroidota bacterium]